MHRQLVYWLLISSFSLFSFKAIPSEITLKSPNGLLSVSAGTSGPDQSLAYTVRYKDQIVLASSPLGLQLQDGTVLGQNMRLVSSREKEIRKTWQPLYGEKNKIPDHYREATILLQQNKAPYLRMNLIIRAYDEGIALRYEIPKQDGMDEATIEKELTAFTFGSDADTWATYTAQGKYEHTKISALKNGVERPLVIRLADTLYAAVGEAAVTDYAPMKLNHAAGLQLLVTPGSPVHLALPLQTPWRFIMAASSPGKLLEHNYLVLNLNEPNQLGRASWIKPGKVIREATLTTTGALTCIDFAARQGLQYIEFDAGWYGKENSDTSDATHVAVDPARSAGPLDLQRVIRYGQSKNIGVILYVNHQALERQLDTLLPLYQRWGVKGVKFGFVQTGSQKWNAWLMQAVRKAAKYHLMVDVHDEYRPTGYSRTYPNLMTQEGIRGDEESPSNSHTLTTLFTRMLAGAADNTVCYFDDRVDAKMGSHASQLAKAICLYSPWQFLFWYDRPVASPQSAGGNKNIIQDVPELALFKELPTVWDDTRVIQGSIGRSATIARRSGSNWYLATINGDQPLKAVIPFDFLQRGKKYKATIYSDSDQKDTPTGVQVTQQPADHSTVFTDTIRPGNGLVIVLKPVN